jgi:23S rRNA pseudouridine2605 synthase
MSKQDKPPFRGNKTKSGDKKPFKRDDKRSSSPEKVESAPVLVEGRIAKVLARSGVASRREVERMIEEGRVKVNGKVLDTPALNVSSTDNIEVDDKPVASIERTRLWLYYKPQGLVTTNNDPEGRPTVFEKLPEELPRVMSIGRLDINTEGLLLLTNDGGLARTLELPSTGWLRRYRVRAHGKIDQAQLDELKDGIAVEGVLYGSIEATLDRVQGSNVWITMGLREGKNREIKVVLGALGLDVNRLIRLSYGPFQLAELEEGKVVEVRGRMLRDQLGPRLIEDSGANFDAPLREHESKEEREKAAEWKPRRKLTEVERKERARDRLSTRPGGFEDRSKRGKFDKDEPKEEKKSGYRGPRDRSANVWMGKGARPTVEKKEDVADRGREPAKGNWHRSKDKLDPQKTFRSKKSGDANGKTSSNKGDTSKGAKPFKSKMKKGPNADRRR